MIVSVTRPKMCFARNCSCVKFADMIVRDDLLYDYCTLFEPVYFNLIPYDRCRIPPENLQVVKNIDELYKVTILEKGVCHV